MKWLKADTEKEMKEHFEKRTNIHIGLVQKYLDKIKDLNLPNVSNATLDREKDHDQSKWHEPEYTPYLHVNWKYKMKDEGKKYEPSKEILDKMNEATFHHIKHNKHHPECWDDKVTLDSLNKNDRDKPSDKIVDATKMPMDYVASMVADWLAMAKEKGTDVFKWAEDNINKRWKFTEDQVNLIYDILDKLGEAQT